MNPRPLSHPVSFIRTHHYHAVPATKHWAQGQRSRTGKGVRVSHLSSTEPSSATLRKAVGTMRRLAPDPLAAAPLSLTTHLSLNDASPPLCSALLCRPSLVHMPFPSPPPSKGFVRATLWRPRRWLMP